jgi:hypothetical protein
MRANPCIWNPAGDVRTLCLTPWSKIRRVPEAFALRNAGKNLDREQQRTIVTEQLAKSHNRGTPAGDIASLGAWSKELGDCRCRAEKRDGDD